MSNQSKPCVSSVVILEEFIYTPSTALHLEVEVVRWVYNVGSEKPSATYKTDAVKTVTNQASGFFSSLSAEFGASLTPRTTSASDAQGIDQPFGGKFVERCLDYLCCEC